MEVNWTGFDRDYSPRMSSLPTYPFQRRRYWSESRRQIASAAEPEGKEQSPTRASFNGHERTIAEASADPAGSNGFSNSDPDFAADLMYQLAWRPQPAVQEQASYEGAWLIFADGGGFGMRLAARLMSRGAHCSLVFPETPRESLSRNSFRIDPA